MKENGVVVVNENFESNVLLIFVVGDVIDCVVLILVVLVEVMVVVVCLFGKGECVMFY